MSGYSVCRLTGRVQHYLNSFNMAVKCQSTGWPLVREKSGKFDFSSRSGKSRGILQIGQGNFKYQESKGISKFLAKICCHHHYHHHIHFTALFPLLRVGLFDKSFSEASSPLRTILRISRIHT